MKTAKNDGSNIRSAAVRLSNAISLEDYKSDMDFLNNKGLADRIKEFPNLLLLYMYNNLGVVQHLQGLEIL